MTMFDEHEPSSQIHEGLLRGGTDLVVVNGRGSAFKDSDLQVLLRSLGVTELVLTGFATSGAVLSTFVEAADLDFGVTVLSDGCADPDEASIEVEAPPACTNSRVGGPITPRAHRP